MKRANMKAGAVTVTVRRFWTERDAEVRLDAGYLSDPEGPYAAFLGSQATVTLETLNAVPCVALLGEPGSGKTTALREEVLRLAGEAGDGDHGEVVLPVDLRNFADIADLRAAAFEHPELLRWRAGTHRLTLALDSLDEALIEMRKLATRLATEIAALPVDRLRVRIACRTADWPTVIEDELGSVWGDGGLRVVEIAPLRRRDVREIATARLGEARTGEFLDAVAAQDAEPFAAKPGTLHFLLESVARLGRLPASKIELYTIGCRALCEEANPSRRAARRTGELSADERMVVAARVSAATIFGGRTAVWTGLDRDVPASDLRRADLVGDEPTRTGIVRVDEPILRDEVLSTGLFTARGPDRLGWAHQTYGEFLAAWWVTRRDLTAEQVLALLTVDDAIGRKLVPQLHETAAWVASLRPELFAAIAGIEPEVLLRSDVAWADPDSQERLVAALLDAAEQNRMAPPEFGQLYRYRQLQHPRLGAQLTTVIADAARPDRVRDLALDIAIACKSREVAAAAADLALDASASMRLRATAAYAVAAVGDDAEGARLRPLALGSEEADEGDELKGSALRAAWRAISPAELFAALSRAKRPNMSGAYERFLGELAEALADEYVAPGMAWVERLGHAASPGEQRLEAAVILRAFALLDDDDVRRGLLAIVRRRLRTYEPLLDGEDERKALAQVLAEPSVRRRLLAALVDDAVRSVGASNDDTGTGESSSESDTTIRRSLDVYTLANAGYFTGDDFPFVLDTLAEAEHAPAHDRRRTIWGTLARDIFAVDRADHTNAVLERVKSAAIRAVFRDMTGSVDLHSPEADAGRRSAQESEARRLQWEAERERSRQRKAEREDEEDTPLPSAARLLTATHTPADPERPDDLARWRWVHVFWELVRDEKGQLPSGGDAGDVRAGIAWRAADADVRRRVIEAAASFVESAAAPVLNSDGDVHRHKYAWAGYVALRLLAAEAPERLDRLRPDIWERWARTVALAEPHRDTAEEQGAHVALARRAREAAARLFDDAVLGVIDYVFAKDHWPLPERVVTAFAATPLGDRVLARCLDVMERDLRDTASAATEPNGATGIALVSDDDGAAAHDRMQRTQAREARKPTFVGLLAALLEGGSEPARAALVRVLENPSALASLDRTSVDAERAFIAAHALLVGADDAGWGVISPIVTAAPEFAKELFLRSARHREVPIKDFRQRLGVRGIGDMFVALANAFPYETDPYHSTVYSPSARDNVVTWRRAMLDALEGWGTADAIAEVQRIQRTLPQYDWLAYSVARARESEGRAAWCPVPPAELFALADNRRRRLVRSDDELLDLVVESLGRYQRVLQGDLPGVVDLWDFSNEIKPRPRDEGQFADHVTRFLKQDLEGRGIAVGCELVVRRGGKGRASGLRTDIYVTAVVGSPTGRERTDGEIACVVIEVKGSWHDEVHSAMRTQLVEDYLSEHAGTRRGIYLVGDFTCDRWTDGEGARRSRALGGATALAKRLDTQAAELSQGGVRVRAVVLDASLPA